MERGLKLLNEVDGTGRPAGKGDRVTYNLRIFLNRGDEVPLDEAQAEEVPAARLRKEGGRPVVDRTITLGKRQVMAAVEHSLTGMREGGYRKVRASPHLAYGKQGIPGLIPENAVLILEIWLRALADDDHAFRDAHMARESEGEPCESLEEVRQKLKAQGKLAESE
ncbi:MAG: FKBP-type peptidyl-prolyl cis-trans isomerase [Acidobacteria bacterium]|nr:FKBP-type peptidyl-prolyl cis-trans isomerase [Acidobacteriota bacterium]